MNYFHYSMTEDQAKARYRELAKKFHPDMTGGNAATMQEINKEYELFKKYLKNPLKSMRPGQAGANTRATKFTMWDNLSEEEKQIVADKLSEAIIWGFAEFINSISKKRR